jgi:competence protein ComEA
VRKPYEPTPLPGRSAFDPGRRGFKALACVAIVVVLGAAYLAWQARSRAEPVVPLQESLASSPLSAQIVVAVSGRVQRPGLVRLPAGSRVADAIEAAGGVLPDTDLTAVNLARKLTDGELIAIGVDAAATPGGKVNLNTATLAQLDSLPGVGPVLAQRIVDYRVQHGGFHSVAELRQVDGIGEETFARLKELVAL